MQLEVFRKASRAPVNLNVQWNENCLVNEILHILYNIIVLYKPFVGKTSTTAPPCDVLEIQPNQVVFHWTAYNRDGIYGILICNVLELVFRVIATYIYSSGQKKVRVSISFSIKRLHKTLVKRLRSGVQRLSKTPCSPLKALSNSVVSGKDIIVLYGL